MNKLVAEELLWPVVPRWI